MGSSPLASYLSMLDRYYALLYSAAWTGSREDCERQRQEMVNQADRLWSKLGGNERGEIVAHQRKRYEERLSLNPS